VNSKLFTAGLLLAAASLVWQSGCCSGHVDQCPQPTSYPFGCYGYHSTCWRPWPAECPNCPSFAIVPPPREEILSDVPMQQNPPLQKLPPPEPPAMPPTGNR